MRLCEPDSESRYALQRLAREQMKLRLLADIAADMQVCRLEGWDCREYIRDLHNELTRLVERCRKGVKNG